MQTIRFSDVLAWAHCPRGQEAGYEPELPLGKLEVGRRLLREWPAKTKALTRLVRNRTGAIEWLERTGFSLQTTGRPSAPDRPRTAGDYWKKLDGYWHREAATGKQVRVELRLPYLHEINGVKEAVWVDTQPLPMSESRWADFAMQHMFTAGVYYRMTGRPLFGRLLAPGYRYEERLDLPFQPPDELIDYVVYKQGVLVRPGSHCSSTREGDRRLSRVWRCPLREAGRCNAFRHNRPRNK